MKKFIMLLLILVISMTGCGKEIQEAKIIEHKEDLVIPSSDYITTPMFYDFINGSLGYKWEYMNEDLANNLGYFYAVMFLDSNPNMALVSSYKWKDEITTPPLGSKYILIELNEDELSVWNNKFESFPDDRRYFEKTEIYGKEVNLSMYLISELDFNNPEAEYLLDSTGRFGNVQIAEEVFNKESEMYYSIYGVKGEKLGVGWDIEWLRKYKKSMEKLGIDVENEFWDKYSYLGQISYYDKSGDELIVTVSQYNEFKFTSKSGNENSLTYDQLEIYLNDIGAKMD